MLGLCVRDACVTEGLGLQVPLIGWMGGWKLVQNAVGGIAPAVTNVMFRRTGSQFFLKDTDVCLARSSAASSLASHQLPDTPDSAVTEEGRSNDDEQPVEAVENTEGNDKGGTMQLNPDDPGSSDVNKADSLPGPPRGTAVPSAVSAKISFLLQLAFDIEKGPQFISGLAAFASRTCYANADGDHLVGWANSSLRFLDELPKLDAHEPGTKVKGIAHAQSIVAAFELPQNQPEEGSAAPDTMLHGTEGVESTSASHTPSADNGCSNPAGSVPVQNAAGTSNPASALQADLGVGGDDGGDNQAGSASRQSGAQAAGKLMPASSFRRPAHLRHQAQTLDSILHSSKPERLAAMLSNLTTMPWCRVDCSWRGARTSTFAHNHIQVTRAWLNMAVCTVLVLILILILMCLCVLHVAAHRVSELQAASAHAMQGTSTLYIFASLCRAKAYVNTWLSCGLIWRRKQQPGIRTTACLSCGRCWDVLNPDRIA